MAEAAEVIEVAGREIKVTNPSKVFFPALGVTKLDLVRYYLSVAPGVMTGMRGRPTLLKRHPNGVEGEHFYQKRAPKVRPEWIQTATVTFPSMRTADYIVMADEAHLAWIANLGCIELHQWPARVPDLDHPDELRVDLDPTPEMTFDDVRTVALVVRDVLVEHGLTGWPKTSGQRGVHVIARIEPLWGFTFVRRAALALGREVERRSPLGTTAWWKEERHGVFVDYNQNARDRSLPGAYSVRAVGDGRVSCPITWDEVATIDPASLTILTVPERFAERGDPEAEMDEHAGRLDALLALAEKDEREGLGEAPWPPHFPKAEREPTRVSPSRAKRIREWEEMKQSQRGKPRD
jgi:bifunctional non-homologous end joining protein LigD